MKLVAFTLLLVSVAGCHSSESARDEYDLADVELPDESASVLDEGGEPPDAGTEDGGVGEVDGGASCDPVGALDGGDPSGHWTVQSGCATGEAFYQVELSCPSMIVQTVDVRSPAGASPTGTLALHASTYLRTMSLRLTAQASVPLSCAQPLGGCAGWASATRTQISWLDQVSCTTEGNVCQCTLDGKVTTNGETGSWVPTETGFALTSSTGVMHTFAASVDDHTLRILGNAQSFEGERGVTLTLVR